MTDKQRLAAEMVKELQNIMKTIHELEYKVKTLLQITHREKYDDDR